MDKRKLTVASLIAAGLLVAVLLLTRGKGSHSSPPVQQAGTVEPTATSATTEAPRPYAAPTGYYVSESDAMGTTVRETWFEDYGRRQATYVTTTVEMMGQKFVTRTVEIADGEWRIEYDVEKRTGTRFRLAANAAAGSTPALPDLSKLTGEQKLEMQVEELPSRTIAGREAAGMSIVMGGLKMRAWTWDGIQLRSEVFLGEKPMVTEVTKIELGGAVSAEKFQVPTDVKLTTH